MSSYYLKIRSLQNGALATQPNKGLDLQLADGGPIYFSGIYACRETMGYEYDNIIKKLVSHDYLNYDEDEDERYDEGVIQVDFWDGDTQNSPAPTRTIEKWFKDNIFRGGGMETFRMEGTKHFIIHYPITKYLMSACLLLVNMGYDGIVANKPIDDVIHECFHSQWTNMSWNTTSLTFTLFYIKCLKEYHFMKHTDFLQMRASGPGNAMRYHVPDYLDYWSKFCHQFREDIAYRILKCSSADGYFNMLVKYSDQRYGNPVKA